MKRFALVLLLLAACRQAPASRPGGPSVAGTGAESPRMAVDAFLRSVRSEDLQAMSAIWGDGQGLARERMDRATLERRELLMMCYFRHDKYRVQHEGPGPGGSRQLMVELARGNEWRSTTFSTVAGANRRWFVQEAQVGPLNDWCKKMP